MQWAVQGMTHYDLNCQSRNVEAARIPEVLSLKKLYLHNVKTTTVKQSFEEIYPDALRFGNLSSTDAPLTLTLSQKSQDIKIAMHVCQFGADIQIMESRDHECEMEVEVEAEVEAEIEREYPIVIPREEVHWSYDELSSHHNIGSVSELLASLSTAPEVLS